MKRRESDLPIQQIKQPIERLTHLENISGIALIGGALVALVLANSPLGDAVASFWKQHLVVAVGPFEVDESLGHWVNDALMAIFFLVAGLEIKRELVVGELREPRKAALPVVAAIGGMIVPALLYVAIAGADVRGGWGVPMATDIAFAVGVISLLGNRIPSKLKLMLLTLAIVDDLGAIVVIAVFYTASLNMTALFVALGLLGAMAALRLLGVWWMPIYALVGVGPWFALLESGVHAPLAGVACGLLAPALPRRSHETTVIASSHHTVDELKEIVFDTRESRSVVDRLSHNLHPFSALPIVPIFAMANTAVTVSPSALADAATSSVSQAIVVGLVLGKPIGIVLASWHPGILARGAVRPRRPAHRRHLDAHRRDGFLGRHRVHRVAVRHPAGVRLRRGDRQRQARRVGRLDSGFGRRRCAVAASHCGPTPWADHVRRVRRHRQRADPGRSRTCRRRRLPRQLKD